jgi:hypothetical protein
VKKSADILAKLVVAFTPPANEHEASFLFRRKLEGITLPALQLENILTRQRTIWKNLEELRKADQRWCEWFNIWGAMIASRQAIKPGVVAYRSADSLV